MSPCAQDALSNKVHRVDAGAPISEMLGEIRRRRASHVAVFAQGTCLGVSSSNDADLSSGDTTFEKLVQHQSCPSVSESTSLEELGQLFSDSSVDAQVVHNDQGEFVGVVTRQSLLEALLEERKQSDEMNVALSNAMPGISRLDTEGRYVEMNEYYAHALGHEPNDLIGNLWTPTVHPEDILGAIQAYEAMCRDGKIEFEARALRKDGSHFHKRVLMVRIDDADGVMTGHHCFMRDITDRKLAEQASREKQAQMDDLLSNVDAIIFEADPFNSYYVGGQVEKILGYPKEMWFEHPKGPGGFWGELLHPDDVDKTKICQQAIERGENYSFEYRMIAKDGKTIWFYDSVIVETREGKPVKTRSVMIDITERKNTEEALRDSEIRSRTLLEGSPVCTKIIDLDSRLQYMSTAGRTQLKICDIEPFYGSLFPTELYPESWRAPVTEHLERAKAGEISSLECPVLDTEGKEVWFDTTFVPARDEDGRVQYVIVTSVNITERKRAEEEARKHRDELAHVSRVSTMGEMATGIAHELNQPLAAIASYSYAAKMSVGNSTSNPIELQNILSKIESQAIRAGAILRRLRDYVKKHKPVRVRADLNMLVQDVANLIEPDIRQAKAVLVLQSHDSSLSVLVDDIQIQQVLVNLIRNAVDAMREIPLSRREVIVSTRILQDGQAEVAVSDSGKGLSPDDVKQAFDAFFSTKKEGMGMGLPISRTLVEAHDGKLWAKPNAGPGMTFSFTIPLEDHDDH